MKTRIKIVSIVGARPQFIKYFPVFREICKLNEDMEKPVQDILIHTGQHYDYKLSEIFFSELGIKDPEYHLGVGSGTQGQQTSQIIDKVEQVLLKEKPEVVLVYGDTNSTLGGALAAAKIYIPVAHVEAGLRSFNKAMPEEINRILTDHMSTFLFCPTETAVQNLKKENFRNVVSYGEMGDRCGSALKNAGISNPLVVNVGDVMYDVFLYVSGVADKKSRILQEMKIKPKDYYLLTIHRQESTGDVKKLAEIMAFVNSVAKERTVIFPMHPRTRKIYDSIGKKFGENVRIVEPVGYFDMFSLLKNSIMLMTDSGGMQKEAYWLKLPCITLRDETEWTETIRSGWNVLYKDYKGSHKCSDAVEFNGDGRASQKIVRLLSSI